MGVGGEGKQGGQATPRFWPENFMPHTEGGDRAALFLGRKLGVLVGHV